MGQQQLGLMASGYGVVAGAGMGAQGFARAGGFAHDGTYVSPSVPPVSPEKATRLRALKAVIEGLSARRLSLPDPIVDLSGVSLLPPEGLLGLPELPHSVILLGARLGEVELATHLAGLGVLVSLVASDGLLPGLDRDLVAEVLPRLRALNIAIHEDVQPVRAEAEGRGVLLTLSGHGAERSLRGQRLMAPVQQDPHAEAGGLHIARLDLTLAGVSAVQMGLKEPEARHLYGSMVRVTRLGLSERFPDAFGFAKIITQGSEVLGVSCVGPLGQAFALMLPWVRPLSDAVLKGHTPRGLLKTMAELDQPALGAEGLAFGLARRRLEEAKAGQKARRAR